MATATYQDVQISLGRTFATDAEKMQAEWWLDGIELLITARLGDLDTLSADAVKYVETEAVAEKVRRAGQTESSITTAVDDGTVTRRWEQPVAVGDITDAWWEILTPSREAAAFSMRPGFEPDTDSSVLNWS